MASGDVQMARVPCLIRDSIGGRVSGSTDGRHMLIRRALAAAVVVALGAVAPVSPAAASPQELFLRQGGSPPQGVGEPQTPPQFAHRGGSGSGKLALRPKVAGQATAQPPGAQPLGEGGGYGCDTVIDWDFGSVGEDDFLEETVDVLFYGAPPRRPRRDRRAAPTQCRRR
jgi:hypothetical protein